MLAYAAFLGLIVKCATKKSLALSMVVIELGRAL